MVERFGLKTFLVFQVIWAPCGLGRRRLRRGTRPCDDVIGGPSDVVMETQDFIGLFFQPKVPEVNSSNN